MAYIILYSYYLDDPTGNSHVDTISEWIDRAKSDFSEWISRAKSDYSNSVHVKIQQVPETIMQVRGRAD